jgi:alpha-ketoglutarate-dependent 2,4-dichlorophenoxyacetate dioxygenase
LSISIRQLRDGFAGEVTGVDCRKVLSPEIVAAIHAGMNEHAVLVFRDQELADEQQLQFTLRFGALEETRGGTPGHIHFRTDREVRRLGRGIKDFSNVGPSGETLTTDSRAHQFKLADQLWHSDSSFNAIPASYSLLSGRSLPSWGGNTEFADMRAAYDALDDRLKRQIENLVCLHSNMYSRGKLGLADFTDEERVAFKPVRQALVRRHPVTGRKSLFLSAHAGEIEGMRIAEARLLLLDLTELATRERFVYSHTWRVNDLVVWDNRSTMHRGRPFDPREVRDIRQTRLAGNGPTIILDRENDPLAEAAKLDNPPPFRGADRHVDRAQEEGAREAYLLDRLVPYARTQRLDVKRDIRIFGQARES